MALQPVVRRSVPEQVFEQIATDVLSGELQPGEALPSERKLAEVLGVSRPAVRRRSSAYRRVGWSRCATVTSPRCVTFDGTPAWNCYPDCWFAMVSSTSRVFPQHTRSPATERS